MKIINSIIIFLLLSFPFNAQNEMDVISFPEDWVGTYEGMMYIYTAKLGMVDSVAVTLKMASTEEKQKWLYEMTFENKRYGKVVKDYRIIKNDTLPEHIYLMDELNGIVIQEVLMGNTFYSSFSVAGNRLFSIMRNERDYIDFEITSMKEAEPLKSANQPEDDGQVFEIESFAPFTTQRAYLFRKL